MTSQVVLLGIVVSKTYEYSEDRVVSVLQKDQFLTRRNNIGLHTAGSLMS